MEKKILIELFQKKKVFIMKIQKAVHNQFLSVLEWKQNIFHFFFKVNDVLVDFMVKKDDLHSNFSSVSEKLKNVIGKFG